MSAGNGRVIDLSGMSPQHADRLAARWRWAALAAAVAAGACSGNGAPRWVTAVVLMAALAAIHQTGRYEGWRRGWLDHQRHLGRIDKAFGRPRRRPGQATAAGESPTP